MSQYPTAPAPTATEPPPVDCHKPTCRVPWPTALIEGGEKAGKSTEAAKFTGCGRFSRSFWLELGTEGTAEWYGLVPGAAYEVLEHDGKLTSFKQRLAQVHAYAEWTIANGQAPICLVVDTIGALWNQIQAWVDWKARQLPSVKDKLEKNPNADVAVPINIRNQGKALWDEILMAIHRIPGVKILLSRGREVTRFENGQPTKDKSWSIVGHSELRFEMDLHARLQRGAHVELCGVRHPVNGIKEDEDGTQAEKVRRKDFSLEWLIFERYGLDPANAAVRHLDDVNDPAAVEQAAANRAATTDAGEVDEGIALQCAELLDAARQATTRDMFLPLWKEMKDKTLFAVRLPGGVMQELMEVQAKRIGQQQQKTPADAARPAAPAPAQRATDPAPAPEPPDEDEPPAADGITVDQRRQIGDLMLKLGVHSDLSQAVLAGELVTRTVRSVGALTGAEAGRVIGELTNLAGLGADGSNTVQSIIAQARTAA